MGGLDYLIVFFVGGGGLTGIAWLIAKALPAVDFSFGSSTGLMLLAGGGIVVGILYSILVQGLRKGLGHGVGGQSFWLAYMASFPGGASVAVTFSGCGQTLGGCNHKRGIRRTKSRVDSHCGYHRLGIDLRHFRIEH